MRRRYLLDTSFLIGTLRCDGRLPESIERSEAVYVSEVAVGEFKAGLDETRRGRQDREALEGFLRLPNVVEITLTSATTEDEEVPSAGPARMAGPPCSRA